MLRRATEEEEREVLAVLAREGAWDENEGEFTEQTQEELDELGWFRMDERDMSASDVLDMAWRDDAITVMAWHEDTETTWAKILEDAPETKEEGEASC